MRLARQHEVQQHGAGGVPAEAKARYQCPECPQTFTLKGHLKRHLHLHTDALPFVCDLCGKAFKWKEVLKRHMLSHGEKTIRESHLPAFDLRVHQHCTSISGRWLRDSALPRKLGTHYKC